MSNTIAKFPNFPFPFSASPRKHTGDNSPVTRLTTADVQYQEKMLLLLATLLQVKFVHEGHRDKVASNSSNFFLDIAHWLLSVMGGTGVLSVVCLRVIYLRSVSK